MSFLSRPRRGTSPPIPDSIGDDVTLAQKKRLAMLAKMGLGPVHEKEQKERQATKSESPQRPKVNRRSVLLEKERRIREQEEQLEREEARREREERRRREEENRKRKAKGGLERLGTVERREEKPIAAPTPIDPISRLPKEPPPPPPGPPPGAALLPPSLGGSFLESTVQAPKMELKISPEVASGARPSGVLPEGDNAQKAADDSSDGEDVPMPWEIDQMRKAELAKAQMMSQPKAGRKKKKNKKRRGRGGEHVAEGDEKESDDDEDDDSRSSRSGERGRAPQPFKPPKPSAAIAFIDSVKGKVSKVNEGWTDADLERRFGSQNSAESSKALMSEEEALKMLNKQRKFEKVEKDKGIVSKRVQREAQEWAQAKAERRTRVRSRSREHLVVSRGFAMRR